MSKKQKIFLVSLMLAGIILYLVIQNNYIDVEHFEIIDDSLPNELDGFKIVHLSDLHLPKTASRIDRIVQLTARENPDVIVLTGDLVHSTASLEDSHLDELAQKLTPIAKVYAIYGNHEERSRSIDLSEWERILDSAGVHVLGEEGSLNLDGYDIWLNHYPMEWMDSGIELVFSGHAHGGQIRIPFLGGVIAPDQGLFPRFTSGLYEFDSGTRLIVSRGLGNSLFPFRINNRPHMPVVTLRK